MMKNILCGALCATLTLLAFAVVSEIGHAQVDAPIAASVIQTDKPFLHPLFSENAVLQRDRALTIWGWTQPETTVVFIFDGHNQTVRSDNTGRWQASLAAHAAGGPHTLTVAGKNRGEYAKRSNLMFGDVWLCSGQSNMEWPLNATNDAAAEKTAANYPNIRLLSVPKTIKNAPIESFNAETWQVCTPQTVGDFSAVGYFFGRKLNRDLNVPIGLIDSSWGGTPAESWVSAPALAPMKDFDGAIEAMNANRANPIQPDQNTATALYNGMISPLLPGQIKGAIWYQGESNAGRAAQYQTLLPTLINDWRARFGAPMPFYIVQLANYQAPTDDPNDGGWAALREAQSLTAQNVPDTGIAVISDIGEANDIHPRNKQDVGLRLALAALHQTYGEPIEYSGPTLENAQTKGGAIALTFDHADGLNLKGEANRVFAVAGADKKWSWATPVINGKIVTLSSPDVAAPVYARFGWASNPRANLYNSAGLPASPFRTDNDEE